MITGVSPPSIKYDVEAQLANAEFQILQADNALQRALLALKQTMNVDLASNIDLKIPDIPVPSRTYLASLSPEVVYAAALLNQGSILGASKAQDIARMNIKMAEAQRYPSVYCKC